MNYITEANSVHEFYVAHIASLANLCIDSAVREVQLKGDLSLTFGMGTELCKYRGYQITFDEGEALWAGDGLPDDCWTEDGTGYKQPTEIDPVCAALDIIDEITDGYRIASPNDIAVDFATGKIIT